MSNVRRLTPFGLTVDLDAMRSLPCLLWCFAVSLFGEDLTAPQTLPLVYPQPVGNCFILRIDSRRYELINQFKDPVAQLLGTANYAQVKALHEVQRRAVVERTNYEGTVTRAQSNLTLATTRVERARQSLDALKQQRIAYRTSTTVDLETLFRLDAAILTTAAQVNQLEDLEDRASTKLADAKAGLTPYDEKVQKTQAEFIAALKDYERTLGEIRTIAIANGKPL